MVPRAGFEPATLSLEVSCSIQLSYRGMVRVARIELASPAWKASIIATIQHPHSYQTIANSPLFFQLKHVINYPC